MKKQKNTKFQLHIRMDEEMHEFYREKAFQENISINSMLCICLNKFKENYKKMLTIENDMVL